MTTVHVAIHETRDASYDVVVGCGVLDQLPALLAGRCPAHGYAVITDSRVKDLYGAKLCGLLQAAGLAAQLCPFPAGEWNKTRETWAEVTDALLKARIGRDGAVIALGGGVTGDLAGFVAATYLRGIPYVQAPTTLLAMIDSSIGGKTGVDVPAGKNLVGAFHQPRFVLADVAVLATLPAPQLAAGMAEAIKHGVIADRTYAGLLRSAAPALRKRALDVLESVVVRSIAIKAEIVTHDEREAGLRQVLNFGHTIGHAVEARAGFALLHGEAVAVGMAVEAALAEDCGIAAAGLKEEVTGLLECYGLPTTVPENLTTDDLLDTLTLDKKVRRGAVRFALPRAVGDMAQSRDGAWTVEVDAERIRHALDTNR